MNRTSLPIAVLLVTAFALPVYAQSRIAVVNVATVSERYQRTSDLEAKFESMRKGFQQQRDEMRDRVERMRRSLQEELKPGTDAFEARRRELAMLEADLQWFVDSKGREIDMGLAESLRTIFADIQQAVRQVADAKGIDIVIAADELPVESPESPTQARQQILLQKVLYWRPTVDLTNEVIDRVNAGYQAERPNTPGATPPTPAPGTANPQ